MERIFWVYCSPVITSITAVALMVMLLPDGLSVTVVRIFIVAIAVLAYAAGVYLIGREWDSGRMANLIHRPPIISKHEVSGDDT